MKYAQVDMKQVEKLDLILKGLYDIGKDSYVSIIRIIEENSIPVETRDELFRLAKRLESDNLIKPIYTRCDVSARLTSQGIDYCECNSYTYNGAAIITNNYNINVENSSSTAIVTNSSKIDVDFKEDVKIKLAKLLELMQADSSLNKEDVINKIKEFVKSL